MYLLKPKGRQRKELLPPSLKQTYGNKHTSLATAGYVWVTNTGTGVVERIDTTTLVSVDYPTNGLMPAGLTFDGTYLYVSSFLSGTVTKMTTSGTISAIFTIAAGLHQIAFDGTNLWVTSYWEGKVYKLSTSGTILATYDTSGRYPVYVIVANGFVWVTLFDFDTAATGVGAVLKLNLDGTLAGEYTIGANPTGIAFDGTYIWVASFLDGYYYKIDATTGAILATYNTGIAGSSNVALTYSSYGSYLLLTVTKDYTPYDLPNNYNKVHIINTSTGDLSVAVEVGVDPRNTSVDEFHYGYVAGYGDGSVTRFLLPAIPISPATITIIAPLLSAITPTYVYIPTYSNTTPHYITKLNLVTKVTTQLALPSDAAAPFQILFDGTNLWVICYGVDGQGTRLICLTETGTILHNITLGTGISRIIQHNGYIYVVSYATGSVYKLDLSGNILASIYLPSLNINYLHLTSITTDGTYVYTHIGMDGYFSTIIRLDMNLANVTVLTVAVPLTQGTEVLSIGNNFFAYNETSVFKFSNSGTLLATFTVPTTVTFLTTDGTSLFVSSIGHTYKVNQTTGVIISTYNHVVLGSMATAIGSGILFAADYLNNKIELIPL
jgi:hypothetical protein